MLLRTAQSGVPRPQVWSAWHAISFPRVRGFARPVFTAVFVLDWQVVAVGSGRVDEKTEEIVKPNVQTGSTVLYSKYSGTEFADDDKQYIVVRESDIIASLA